MLASLRSMVSSLLVFTLCCSAIAVYAEPIKSVEAGKQDVKGHQGQGGPANEKTVNVNTATKEELEALPGIGPIKAQAIIEGRPYRKAEDLLKVKGIKGGTYKQIKDLIRVD